LTALVDFTLGTGVERPVVNEALGDRLRRNVETCRKQVSGKDPAGRALATEFRAAATADGRVVHSWTEKFRNATMHWFELLGDAM